MLERQIWIENKQKIDGFSAFSCCNIISIITTQWDKE